MKKAVFTVFAIICASVLFSLSANEDVKKVKDDLQDKIALSRIGGTTRGADATPTGTIMVDAYNTQDIITINVQNYRGGAWVEIIGGRGGRQSYFEVYDMGFDVINISDLRAGEYTIRITIGSEVHTGKFRKATYGR